MKKVIIIGGGIAGLSGAGIFSQINGFESIILEKNPYYSSFWTYQGLK